MTAVIKGPFVLEVGQIRGILQVNYRVGFQRLDIERADIPTLITALNMWQAGGFDPEPGLSSKEEEIKPCG